MCSRKEREKYKKHAARQKNVPKPPSDKSPKLVPVVKKSKMAPRQGSRYFAAGDSVPR
jgi:hypothetical protein